MTTFWKLAVLSVFLLLGANIYASGNDIPKQVWVNEAIVKTYTFNHNNYLAMQKEIARYFTAHAWKAYSKALLASNVLETIQKNHYSVSAVALWPPDVTKVAEDNWQANMPILVVYDNPRSKQKQTLNVTITFTTARTGQGVRGLAITSFQTKPTQPPCTCEKE